LSVGRRRLRRPGDDPLRHRERIRLCRDTDIKAFQRPTIPRLPHEGAGAAAMRLKILKIRGPKNVLTSSTNRPGHSRATPRRASRHAEVCHPLDRDRRRSGVRRKARIRKETIARKTFCPRPRRAVESRRIRRRWGGSRGHHPGPGQTADKDETQRGSLSRRNKGKDKTIFA